MIQRPKRALTCVHRPVSCSEIDNTTTFHIEHQEVRQSVAVISVIRTQAWPQKAYIIDHGALQTRYHIPHTLLIMGYNFPLVFY
jgi:hypothetical protein